MSDNERAAQMVAKATMGAVQELARQGGTNIGTPHGAGQLGVYAVQGLAAAAPAVAAGATAAVTTTMAAATAAATILAPVVVVGAAGYAAYKIFKAVTE